MQAYRKVMAAYRRVYDSRHLQADCQEPRSALEPYARHSSMGYLYFFNLPNLASQNEVNSSLARSLPDIHISCISRAFDTYLLNKRQLTFLLIAAEVCTPLSAR